MKISDILRHKPDHSGSDVVTIAPDALVTEMLALLARHQIGALVVADGDTVVGIVTERDIVRRLNEQGAALLESPVSAIMTTSVFSCAPGDDIDSIATTMTEQRIRHMPVIENDALVGLVSIGDVVSSRMRQLEQDRGQLEQYITG
jgi:CBS domain-containing protein